MDSNNRTARLAGALYLTVAATGAFSMLYVASALIVPGDAAATADRIMALQSLFRLGFVSALICQITFVLLVVALYTLLRSVDRLHALAMLALALVGVPIACLNMVSQFAALPILSGAGYLQAFDAAQLRALVLLFAQFHEIGVMIAQIFWGLWLFPLGYLVWRSGFLPKILGILLMIGCCGYVVHSFRMFLVPDNRAVETVSSLLLVASFVGEMSFAFWLLIKGVRTPRLA